MKLAALVVLVLPPLSSVAGAQVRLRVGDALPTGDLVTALDRPCIDATGSWLVWVDTAFPDPTQDSFLVRDGVAVMREGAPLPFDPLASIDEFVEHWPGANGDLAHVMQVRLGALPPFEGLFFGEQALILRDEPLAAPELPPGTPWDRTEAVRVNGARSVLALAEVRNAAVVREDALVRFQLDANGAVVSTHVLLTKGQVVPALGGVVDTLGSGFGTALAQNERGDFATAVRTALDGKEAVLRNLDEVLARTGDPAPVSGRSYRVPGIRIALDEVGGHAFTALLDGSSARFCIVRNGAKFVQEGDLLPMFAGPLADDFVAPLFLADSGEVYWMGTSDVGGDTAYLRERTVIVQEGVSFVGGRLVVDVPRGPDGFHVSPGGRFWTGLVELDVDGDALLTADFGLVSPIASCAGNSASLVKASGEARVGQTLTLALDDAQAIGAVPLLTFATERIGPPCGAPTVAGELLLAAGSRVATLAGPAWTGAPVAFALPIPAAAALVDLKLFAQGAFVAPPGPAPRLVLSDALRIEIGAP